MNRLGIKINYKCNYCGSENEDGKWRLDKQKGIGFICEECFNEKYKSSRRKISWWDGYKKVVTYLVETADNDTLCTINTIHQNTGVHHQMIQKVLDLMEFNNYLKYYQLEVKSIKVSNKCDNKKVVGLRKL